MADKILLCISAAQAVVSHQRGRNVVRCEIFGADEDGLAAFGEFMVAAGNALVYLAADTVEEDYRFETLPHATGSDRSGMLDRKLKQYYRNSPYVTALSRGRSGDKRRDDRYLFAALTNPALIDPWLNVIKQAGLPVAGIYLVSMLTTALVHKTGHDLSHALVAAPHGAGLRLTYCKNGEFFVSRLSRGTISGSDAAHAYATEIANTRNYLSSLHLDSLDDTLTVLFIDHHDSLGPVIDRVAADVANVDCVRVDRETLVRQLGIAPEHLDVALETAYLLLIAENPPGANLAPASITAGHRQYQRGKAVYAASTIVGVAGLMWAGYNLWHAHDLQEQTVYDAKRTAAAQAQYREITREFPAAPTTSENLINAVEIYKKIARTVRSPQPFMQIVSRAIEPSPEVFLQEISWSYGNEAVNVDAGTRAMQSAAAPVVAGALRQSGYISGEIRPFQGDYRAAIDAINVIANRLARDPAVAEVRVVKHPLNVNPGLALSGNTRAAAEHSDVADFKIVVTLKPDV